ncbi:MAG TPA: hypothetical protein VJ375_13415 [Gaiellaceae bacterium]|nr:hypothetical protein [Gaiellaceae bacterium]
MDRDRGPAPFRVTQAVNVRCVEVERAAGAVRDLAGVQSEVGELEAIRW